MKPTDRKALHLGQLHPHASHYERRHVIEKDDKVFVTVKETHQDFRGDAVVLTRRYEGRVVDKTHGHDPVVLCEIHNMGKKELRLARPSQLTPRGVHGHSFF